MQQKLTEFFEENKTIDLDKFSDIDILKMMITPAEYEAGLQSFVSDMPSSSTSSPRSPRSPGEVQENLSDVDGGARKSKKSRKSRKSRKYRKKTAKRRHTKK
jgi:hypothetical protein